MAYGACAIFGQSVAAESHITAQLPKMMSVRELQILGEEREEKDRMQCGESLLAFGLGKNVHHSAASLIHFVAPSRGSIAAILTIDAPGLPPHRRH